MLPHLDNIAGLPAHPLTGNDLDLLELLVGGLLAPVDGYCLPGRALPGWPADFILTISAELRGEVEAQKGLLLTDSDGTPLGHLSVDSTESVPWPSTLVYVSGKVSALRPAEHPPARNIRLTRPLPTPESHMSGNFAAVFGTIPRAQDVAAAITTATENNCKLWLIAACGPQEHGRYTVTDILEELRAVSAYVPHSSLGLLIVPDFNPQVTLAEHVWHRQLLKNLNATHVMYYSQPPAQVPQVVDTTVQRHQGAVVFLTGLSGSGKSTVARALAERLQETSPNPISLLDGDDVRRILSPGLGFSREDRDANIYRLGWVSSLVSSAGGTAICAPIAPFDEARQTVRGLAENVGRFFLVHISTPLAACEQRDRKGLYAKARRGEIVDFTGIDSPYDFPADADLHLDTSVISVEEAVDQIAGLIAGSVPSPPQDEDFLVMPASLEVPLSR